MASIFHKGISVYIALAKIKLLFLILITIRPLHMTIDIQNMDQQNRFRFVHFAILLNLLKHSKDENISDASFVWKVEYIFDPFKLLIIIRQ